MDTIDRDIEDAELEASRENYPQDPAAPITTGTTSDSSSDTLSTVPGRKGRKGHPTELDRIATYRTIHSTTVGAQATSRTNTGIQRVKTLGAGKVFAPADYNVEDFLVEFDGHDDPLHPQNWSLRRRVILTCILTYNVFLASFASAIYSAGIEGVSKRFHVSPEVATLGLSLYVFGFATGPIVWGPMSELSGRLKPVIIGQIGFSIFTVGSATAKDFQTLMLTRYFAGCFAASVLTVAPACLADMYNNRQRGLAITAFAMGVFVGPFTAPFVGGFIADSHLHWRWTMYIASIMGFLGTGLLVFFRETYPPSILVAKAGRLRRQTHDWRIHAKQEEVEVDFKELISTNFTRPMRMLVTEPIVLLVTIYMSFIYGLMYAFLGAYPLVFEGVHGMNEGVGGLPFIGLVIGQLFAGIYVMLIQSSYLKKLDGNNGVPIPEWRLPPVIVGAFAFAIGLFWFGWTGWSPHIHWMVPTASGIVTGFGILCIFLQAFNYLVDAYVMFAASVIAANSILRSFVAGAFPLFTRQMFDNLGIQWAGTLLACLATVMIPIPIGFYLYGSRLRKRSAYLKPAAKKEDVESPYDSDEKAI